MMKSQIKIWMLNLKVLQHEIKMYQLFQIHWKFALWNFREIAKPSEVSDGEDKKEEKVEKV